MDNRIDELNRDAASGDDRMRPAATDCLAIQARRCQSSAQPPGRATLQGSSREP